MSQYANGFEPDHYLARSWALLTRDSGWIKPVLVLALVCLVPIIGPMAALGYFLEWARLTAWGVDAAPKQKKVNVGQVIASGWRGVVVGFVWMGVLWLAEALVNWLLGLIPGESQSYLPNFMTGIWTVLDVIVAVVVMVAQIRSAIYQKIGPGFRLDRMRDMLRHDFWNLTRMVGMAALGIIIQIVVGIVFVAIAAAIVVPYAISFGYGMLPGRYALASSLQGLFSSLGPLAVIGIYVELVVAQIFHMLTYTGVGLLMRQFDVPHWGKSADPLPSTVEPRVDEPPVRPEGTPDAGPTGQGAPHTGETTGAGAAAGYQQGAYRPDQPGDEGQAGVMPPSGDEGTGSGLDAGRPDGDGEGVEHIL